MTPSKLWDAALLGGVVAGSYLLKRYYSVAIADELDWLLRPTAGLVEQASGHRFTREAGLGYVCPELSLVIAPVCAGLNFLIVAFVALTFGFLPRLRAPGQKLGWLWGSALLAYVATLLVNAARIALSIALRHWSSPELHRIEGIVVYFASLLVLYFAVEACFDGPRARGGRMLALPLGCYLGMTLVVPFCRGACANPEYWRHAGVVVLASGLLALLAVAVHVMGRSRPAYSLCDSTR